MAKTWQPTAAWAERYDSSFAQAMEFLDRSRKERDQLLAEQEATRKRKLRRTQWIAGVLAVLAVVALSLAYAAWRERGRAEANLQSAKEAVEASLSSAGSQQAREAADLPEVEKFREDLLGKAEIFYARIAEQNSNNEGLRFDSAEAHSRLGDINRLLGKHDKAIQEYNQAISGFEGLARDYPSRTKYRQAQGYSRNWLGETMRIGLEAGRTTSFSPADAEKQYDEALHLQQQIHDANPGNSTYQQELARTYYNRGILHFDNGDLSNSESDFRQAIQLLRPVAEKNAEAPAGSTNPQPSQDLARAYNNLAYLLGRERRLPEAVQFSGLAIGIHEGLRRTDPDNREYKMELAQFYYTMANLLVDENRMDQAEQKNQQALALYDELAAPPSSLEAERAKAQMLRDWLNPGNKRSVSEISV